MKLNKIFLNTAIVIALAFGTKIFAFMREMIIAKTFGASQITDCFYLALSVPQMLVVFFGLDAAKGVSTTLLTSAKNTDSKVLKKEFSLIFWYILIISILITILSFLFIQPLLQILAPGFGKVELIQSYNFVKILISLVVGISIFRFFTSLFGVYHKFFWQNIFELIINVTVVVVLLISKTTKLSYVAYTLLIAYLVSIIIQYIIINRNKVSVSFISPKEFVSYSKKIIFLVAPLLLVTNAHEIAKAVDKAIGSTLEEGVITAIGLASMVANVLFHLVVTPIMKIYYPLFSESVCKSKWSSLSKQFNNVYTLLFVILVPILIFGFLFHKETIAALFYRGEFDLMDLRITSSCFRIYILSIFSAILYQVPTFIFLSHKKNKILGLYGSTSFIINIIASIVLSRLFGYIGIPLGTLLGMSFYGIALNIKVVKECKIFFNLKHIRFQFFYILCSLISLIIIYFFKFKHENYLYSFGVNAAIFFPFYGIFVYVGYRFIKIYDKNAT